MFCAERKGSYMTQRMLNALEENPIIAAAKDDESLVKALQSSCRVVFLLYGNLMTVAGLVKQVQAAGKLAFVHMDLIEGLSSKEIAVDSLKAMAGPEGIISTRAGQIRRARHLGMMTVQRFFIIDSMSLRGMQSQLKTGKPDFVEVLPGLMPRVITDVVQITEAPLIASGLIQYKDEVVAALRAGAAAISTTAAAVWEL